MTGVQTCALPIFLVFFSGKQNEFEGANIAQLEKLVNDYSGAEGEYDNWCFQLGKTVKQLKLEPDFQKLMLPEDDPNFEDYASLDRKSVV